MFLQTYETEAPLLHAVIALGALDKTSQTSHTTHTSASGFSSWVTLSACSKTVHKGDTLRSKDWEERSPRGPIELPRNLVFQGLVWATQLGAPANQDRYLFDEPVE